MAGDVGDAFIEESDTGFPLNIIPEDYVQPPLAMLWEHTAQTEMLTACANVQPQNLGKTFDDDLDAKTLVLGQYEEDSQVPEPSPIAAEPNSVQPNSETFQDGETRDSERLSEAVIGESHGPGTEPEMAGEAIATGGSNEDQLAGNQPLPGKAKKRERSHEEVANHRKTSREWHSKWVKKGVPRTEPAPAPRAADEPSDPPAPAAPEIDVDPDMLQKAGEWSISKPFHNCWPVQTVLVLLAFDRCRPSLVTCAL